MGRKGGHAKRRERVRQQKEARRLEVLRQKQQSDRARVSWAARPGYAAAVAAERAWRSNRDRLEDRWAQYNRNCAFMGQGAAVRILAGDDARVAAWAARTAGAAAGAAVARAASTIAEAAAARAVVEAARQARKAVVDAGQAAALAAEFAVAVKKDAADTKARNAAQFAFVADRWAGQARVVERRPFLASFSQALR